MWMRRCSTQSALAQRATTQKVVAALEQGSTYHGYKDPAAQPSLRYEIVGSEEFLEPLPTLRKAGHRVPMTDYHAIMARIDHAQLGGEARRQGDLDLGLSRRRGQPVGMGSGRTVG